MLNYGGSERVAHCHLKGIAPGGACGCRTLEPGLALAGKTGGGPPALPVLYMHACTYACKRFDLGGEDGRRPSRFPRPGQPTSFWDDVLDHLLTDHLLTDHLLTDHYLLTRLTSPWPAELLLNNTLDNPIQLLELRLQSQ